MPPSPYRAVFCDLRSDQIIDTLPLTGPRFDTFIGKTGTLQASIPVPDAAMARRVRAAVAPARTAVWLERGTDIWWGGIVWTADLAPATRGGPATMGIQAATFDSYLYHRLLVDGREGEQVDQFDIARQLVDYVQSKPGGDIGIDIDWGQTSGVLRDRPYSRYDLSYVGELLDQLAAVDNGFEWRIHTYRGNDGRRVKSLQLGYPRIRASRTELVLSHPGQVLDYRFPEDGTERATHWISRGETVNSNLAEASYPLMSAEHSIAGAIAANWPRLDGTSDYTTVSKKATLDAHAKADLTTAWTRTVIPEVTVRVEGSGLSPQMLGATIRLRLRDLWHEDGLDVRYRLVGMSVTPPTRTSAETATLTLETPPPADTSHAVRIHAEEVL